MRGDKTDIGNGDDTAATEAKRIGRSAYAWNTASGLLMAFQSVIMLVILTRTCDIQEAGIFTIAYANANLFLSMGNFGMRRYQVSDRVNQFSFSEYRSSRIITCAAMMVTSTAYLAYSAITLSYTLEKTVVILFMCLFKLVDSVEDVFQGHYQQNGRLDIGARMLTIRLATTLCLFGTTTIVIRSLAPALIASTVYTALFLVFEVVFVKRRHHLPAPSATYALRNVLQLIKACFPLFAADFLLYYIGNAPKYAIDALMNDAAQAYYGYIAMPSFMVNLIASFFYTPMIASLANQWRDREIGAFKKSFLKLYSIILVITLACVIGAYAIGIPVLNLLYNAQLEPLRLELLALVAGGGFLAMVQLSNLGITIIRFQRILIPLYLVVAIASVFVSNWAVLNWEITGASAAYFICMATLTLLFVMSFIVGIRIQNHPGNPGSRRASGGAGTADPSASDASAISYSPDSPASSTNSTERP